MLLFTWSLLGQYQIKIPRTPPAAAPAITSNTPRKRLWTVEPVLNIAEGDSNRMSYKLFADASSYAYLGSRLANYDWVDQQQGLSGPERDEGSPGRGDEPIAPGLASWGLDKKQWKWANSRALASWWMTGWYKGWAVEDSHLRGLWLGDLLPFCPPGS